MNFVTQKLLLNHRLACFMPVWLLLLAFSSSAVFADDDTPWEFNPYRVHCWVSIDPAFGWDEAKQSSLVSQISAAVDRSFGSAATVTAGLTPDAFVGDLLYSLEDLRLETLLGRELVIATSRKHPEGKEARTIESAIEKLGDVLCNATNIESFQNSLRANSEVAGFTTIADRLKPSSGLTADAEGLDPVAVSLANAEIPIAIVSRAMAKRNSKEIRVLPAIYPWHMQSILNRYDKIFAIVLNRADFGTSIQLREIDCLFRTVGLMHTETAIYDALINDRVASMCSQAIIPYARLETATASTAVVRVRAGGLIGESPNHPCFIGSGDVLRPTIRRDDRSGEPSLIQVVPWTFLVATEGKDAKFDCAIFSGIRGALQGRPNRRLYKLATLVKPTLESTDLKLKIAGPLGKIVPGSGVYRRTPGTEDLELIGRSDWRGIISIDYKSLPTVKYELPVDEKKAKDEATKSNAVANKTETSQSSPAASSEKPSSDNVASDETAAKDAEPTAEKSEGDAKKVETPPEPPKVPMGEIKANAPLYFYYIKNGNILLARLPVVTGLDELQVADLPDDSKRLEAEAFIKGLGSEILDIVARRQILKRKIELAISSKDYEEAKRLFIELQSVKDYESFSEDLNSIQRRILTSSAGQISVGTQRRIDKMFDDTRKQMQQHLQDTIVRELEVQLRGIENAAGASGNS